MVLSMKRVQTHTHIELPSITLFLFSSAPPGFQFFEASAKDNVNVKEVFDSLVDAICEKMKENPNGDEAPSSGNKGPNLNETPSPSQRGCAC